MKRSVLAALCFGIVLPAVALPPGKVTLTCLSLRFAPATGGGGQVATLELTSDGSFSDLNGELWPTFDNNLPSHASFFRMEDPTFPESLVGQVAFDTPSVVDANGNGFDDFFEVSQGVATSTTRGIFTSPVDNGSVTATWNRPEGELTGTCRLRLTGDAFGQLPDFNLTFRLLEYTGTFAYVPGTNSVSGTFSLAETGNLTNTVVAPITYLKSAAQPLDRLTFPRGTLTNSAGQGIAYQSGELQRDGTNYFGYFDFVDGDLQTGSADYLTWILSIDDANDADGNGIPDLSDVPSSQPARQPILSLQKRAGQLDLGIQAEPGRAYDVEETGSLGQTWQKVLSVTLTNQTQGVSLPLPDTATRFWRVKHP